MAKDGDLLDELYYQTSLCEEGHELTDLEFKKVVLRVLSELRDQMAIIENNAAGFDVMLKKHSEESAARHDEFLAAFPAEDLEGHRRYHESVIEWRELRNKMVREALVKCSGATGVAAFMWLLYAIWVTFKMEIQK